MKEDGLKMWSYFGLSEENLYGYLLDILFSPQPNNCVGGAW